MPGPEWAPEAASSGGLGTAFLSGGRCRIWLGLGVRVQGSGFRVGGQRFRGGLVFKVHRLLCNSTLGLRVIKKKKKISGPYGLDPKP